MTRWRNPFTFTLNDNINEQPGRGTTAKKTLPIQHRYNFIGEGYITMREREREKKTSSLIF